ncbi:MAG TPA: bifunctional nuclease family protein [Methanoregulaceae archaeon]|nr:bifunctional nuclease family protein [Methanoregulaceae archaeon]
MATSLYGASPAVILSLDNDSCLPIYIGLWEAISINNALNNEISPRPLTHDLFVEFLQNYEISLKGLFIDTLKDGVYYANLILQKDHHERSMDCRPSDGIAIGIRCNADIFIDRRVVDESAIKIEDLPELVDLSTYLSG